MVVQFAIYEKIKSPMFMPSLIKMLAWAYMSKVEAKGYGPYLYFGAIHSLRLAIKGNGCHLKRI